MYNREGFSSYTFSELAALVKAGTRWSANLGGEGVSLLTVQTRPRLALGIIKLTNREMEWGVE
jgi:hypothetical protein